MNNELVGDDIFVKHRVGFALFLGMVASGTPSPKKNGENNMPRSGVSLMQTSGTDGYETGNNCL